jgi:Leucine-rich repeat (LRR) protein
MGNPDCEDLPSVCARIPSLETLDLSRNKLEEIEQGAFEGATSIKEM